MTPYLGPVATRCKFPIGVYSNTSGPFMARKAHFARDTITALKFVFVNGSAGPGPGEIGTGATLGIKAAVEYAGASAQILFSGAASVTVPDQTVIESDWTTVSIPNGALFFSRTLFTPAGSNVAYGNPTIKSLGLGDGLMQSATDLTLSTGAVTDNSYGSMGPVAPGFSEAP